MPLIEGTCLTRMFFQKPLPLYKFSHIHQLKHKRQTPKKDVSILGSPKNHTSDCQINKKPILSFPSPNSNIKLRRLVKSEGKTYSHPNHLNQSSNMFFVDQVGTLNSNKICIKNVFIILIHSLSQIKYLFYHFFFLSQFFMVVFSCLKLSVFLF